MDYLEGKENGRVEISRIGLSEVLQPIPRFFGGERLN